MKAARRAGVAAGRFARRLFRRMIERGIAPFGYEIRPLEREPPPPEPVPPVATPRDGPLRAYVENVEVGARNLQVKQARVAAGGPFEWPNIVALNQAVVGMVASARRIVELGGGTGTFAYDAAADPDRFVVSSEFDVEASRWAQANRSRPNIRYVEGPVGPADGPFDLLVAIEIIEHVRDYPAFLEAAGRLAPRAIFTTPNKVRPGAGPVAGPPAYEQHVREWSAGELYWVLRCFYQEVSLFSMPDQFVPRIVPVQVGDELTPLIAECVGPRLG